MMVIDNALQFARNNYFRGSEVRFRNEKWRWRGLRRSLMVDVCGRHRGVYIIVINQDGMIRDYYRLRGYQPRC